MENPNTKSFDINYYLQLILRKKWLLILPLLVGVLGAIVFIYHSDPVYEAKTIIRVGGKRLLSRSVESVIPGSRGIGSIRLLRRQILSHENIQRLITKLNLKEDSNIENLDEKARNIKQDYPNIALEEIKNYLIVDRLKKDFTVNQSGSNFIEIYARASSSQRAYLLAKTLTAIFIDATLKEELSGIRSSLEFSSEQLQIYKEKLEESERKLEEYKQKIAAEEVDDYEAISVNLNMADSLIASIDFGIKQKENELESIDEQLDGFLKTISLPESDEFRRIKQKMLRNINKLSDLSMRFSWRDGEVIRLNKEISQLKDKLKELIAKKVEDTMNIQNKRQLDLLMEKQMKLIDLEVLDRRKQSILDIRDKYREKMQEGPTVNLTLNRLQQEVNANRAIYDLFLQQSRGSQIEQSLQRTEAEYKLKIIEPAKKPMSPIEPNKKKILLVGMFLGLAIGVGSIVGLEFINQTYNDVKMLEKDLELPVLGIVPKLHFKEKKDTFIKSLFKIATPALLFIIFLFLILKFNLLNF